MIRALSILTSRTNPVLFIEASANLQKGEKIILDGPNGHGKRLCWMITGKEGPDERLIPTNRGVSIRSSARMWGDSWAQPGDYLPKTRHCRGRYDEYTRLNGSVVC
jgi:ATPase subunit of ABC transporter with duplicated ATPase domains